MASSRRLPTNYNVSTYGNATRDYTSLATWEAATDNDLVTATAGEVLECYDDAASFDDYVEIAGATTSSSYFRVIKPADGEGHDGTPNNGVFFRGETDGMLDIRESYSSIHDIIAKSTITGTGDKKCFRSDASYSAFVGCIAYECAEFGFRILTGPSYIINCAAINCTETGINFEDHNIVAYNCTVSNCDIGFNLNDKTSTLKNCLAYDNTSNNIANDSSATKTTCYEGDDVTFVDDTSDDYHLASSDTTCRGNGTDLSADAVYAFNDDIDGTTRSAWDIGFDEYVAVATAWANKIYGITSAAKINGIAIGSIEKVDGV